MKIQFLHKTLIACLGVFCVTWLLLATNLYSEQVKYTCPMHPHYISEQFGTCPICGMDLVEMEAGTAGDGEDGDQGISLPGYMVQRTGVRSKAVETAYFGRSLRSFGEVVVNRRLQSDVSPRVEGWIEELTVDAEGDEVHAGSLLFRYYSPQLVAAQQDFLNALSTGNVVRIQVTADRLRSLGVQKQVITQIRNSKQLIRNVPYYAVRSGSVENISVRQGSYLRPGDTAMRIQGYEKVWIQVNLAEQDISFVSPASRVDVDFPNLGIHRENVAIDYISPLVDPATRTAQLRLVIENGEGTIRPGAYTDVTIITEISPRLAIPYESMLLNKDGHYVIVDLGEGRFQARQIKPGMQYKGLVEVQAGLMEGEKVVVTGQFLIDSESSLRESFQRMEKLALSLSDVEMTEQQMVLVNHVIEGVIYLHETLTAGEQPRLEMLGAALKSAKKLDHEMQGTRLAFVVDDFLAATEQVEKIMTKSGWLQLLADSTKALAPWITEGRPGYYKELGLALYKTEDERLWLQFAGDRLNPYGDMAAREISLDGDATLHKGGQ